MPISTRTMSSTVHHRSGTIRHMFGLILCLGLVSFTVLVVTFQRLTPLDIEVKPTSNAPLETAPHYPGLNLTREQHVVNAIQHAWRGYVYYALDTDELLPIKRAGQNRLGKVQLTLIDALDTLMLANLQAEVAEARTHLASTSFRQNAYSATAELSTRVVPGLLSAFEISRDELYLAKARDLVYRVIPAFVECSRSTSPSTVTAYDREHDTAAKMNAPRWNRTILPTAHVHLIFGQPHELIQQVLQGPSNRVITLADAASPVLALSQLSRHTHDREYADLANATLRTLWRAHAASASTVNPLEAQLPGLLPLNYDVDTGEALSLGFYSFGLETGRYYEILLNLYIVTGGVHHEVLTKYISAMDDMIAHLIVDFELPHDVKGKALVSVLGKYKTKEMDSSVCFVPGMLAKGAQYGREHAVGELVERYVVHMDVAKGLLATCVHLYLREPTQLNAETYEWILPTWTSLQVQKEVEGHGFGLGSDATIGSLFTLYRVTQDAQYREMGWTIFKALERHCRTEVAYAPLESVKEKNHVEHQDPMDSALLSQTLKYLYLLFSPVEVFPFDTHVFTSQGHPLKIQSSM